MFYSLRPNADIDGLIGHTRGSQLSEQTVIASRDMLDTADHVCAYKQRALVNPPDGEEDVPVDGFQVVSWDDLSCE